MAAMTYELVGDTDTARLILNVEVIPARQGEGIARALYEHADDAQGLYHIPEWGRSEDGDAFAEAMGGDDLDIENETIAYLGGYGTPAQQQLFQDAAERIRDVYAARWPDAAEDAEGMIADQLDGAAQYALGDLTLAEAGQAVRDARLAYEHALDVLAGAMCAAREDRYTVSQVAEAADVTRASVYKRTEA